MLRPWLELNQNSACWVRSDQRCMLRPRVVGAQPKILLLGSLVTKGAHKGCFKICDCQIHKTWTTHTQHEPFHQNSNFVTPACRSVHIYIHMYAFVYVRVCPYVYLYIQRVYRVGPREYQCVCIRCMSIDTYASPGSAIRPIVPTPDALCIALPASLPRPRPTPAFQSPTSHTLHAHAPHATPYPRFPPTSPRPARLAGRTATVPGQVAFHRDYLSCIPESMRP